VENWQLEAQRAIEAGLPVEMTHDFTLEGAQQKEAARQAEAEQARIAAEVAAQQAAQPLALPNPRAHARQFAAAARRVRQPHPDRQDAGRA
jgi:hypothetical protein